MLFLFLDNWKIIKSNLIILKEFLIMISLDGMITFIKAAELGSFSAAGQILRQSAAVVSHRIMALENELGCRLFLRTTRKVQLTDQGRTFYERCLEVREALERAEASVIESGTSIKGHVRITAPLGIGRRLVAPLAGRFRLVQPQVELHLRLSDHVLDLMTESVDLALRLAVMADSALIQRKIMDIPRILCASPRYLTEHGMPKSPEELQQHQCLLLRFPGSRQFRWPLMVGGELKIVTVQGMLDADDGDVLTDWAIQGHGIVMKPMFEIAHALADGRLVQVLPHCPPQTVSLALLFPHRNLQPARVKIFADFLFDEARNYVMEQNKLWRP
jgi:DNA-binding transcriptional LysR family regulator